jgi:hypothetical protein
MDRWRPRPLVVILEGVERIPGDTRAGPRKMFVNSAT